MRFNRAHGLPIISKVDFKTHARHRIPQL
jgi:hypothetical protein